MGKYVKKTNYRRQEDRNLSVRAVHRDPPDMHKLCELLIRMTFDDIERSRIQRRATELPETYRPTEEHPAPARTDPTDR